MDEEPSDIDGHKDSTDSPSTKNIASSPETIKNSNANEEVDSIIERAWKLSDEGKIVDAEKGTISYLQEIPKYSEIKSFIG